MSMLRTTTTALLVATLLATGAAQAQDSTSATTASGGFAPNLAPAAGFGVTGAWVISGEASGHFHKTTGGGWDVALQPALDVFIAPSVSVGGVVLVAHDSGGFTTLGLGARAGYNINFNDRVGFWPMGGLRVQRTSDSMMHTSDNAAAAHFFAPFLFHIVPHLFVGAGPSFDLGLSDSHKTLGVDTLVAGWF